MMVAQADIQHVCSQIAAVCHKIGNQWADHADNMNVDPEQRLEAAHKALQMRATASTIQAAATDTRTLQTRLEEAEKRLQTIADLVDAFMSELKHTPSDACYHQTLLELRAVLQ